MNTNKKTQPKSLQIELNGLLLDVLHDDIFEENVRRSSQVLHEHASHEIYYIESGEMTLEWNDHLYVLSQGDLFIICARDTHRVVQYSNTFRWFHFRFRILTESQIGFVKGMYLPHYQPEIMKNLLSNLHTYNKEDNSVMVLYRFKCYIGIFLSYVFESLMPVQEESMSNTSDSVAVKSRIVRYSQIDTFLYDNCAGSVRLYDLAQHLNYSEIQTARIVRECCGMTFSEKLREIRIRLAKQLLTTCNLTINQVAEQCGYQTRQGFESAFTSVVGVTPSVFRKMYEYPAQY